MSGSVVFGFLLAFCLVSASAEPSKASKATSDSAKSRWLDCENLEVIDYVRAGAIVVGFVALVLSDKGGKENPRRKKHNQWVNAEVIIWFGCGMLAYFFPAQLLSYFSNKKIGMWHQVEMQMVGVVMTCNAVMSARIQSSIENDALVHSSWLISRLVTSLAGVFIVTYAHFSDSDFTPQHLYIRCFALLLWALGNLYQLLCGAKVRPGSPSRTALTSGINRYILLDIVYMLPVLVGMLADTKRGYSYFTDHAVDDLIAHLGQCQAVMVMMMCLQSLGALYFSDENVKRELFFGRLLMMAMSVPLTALYQWKYALMSYNGFIIMLVMYSFQTGYYYLAHTQDNAPKLKSR